MSQLPILIADDQRDVLEALRMMLKGRRHGLRRRLRSRGGNRGGEAPAFRLCAARSELQPRLPSGREGIELIQQLRAIEAQLPIVVMTAWGTIDLAVQAMRHGAGDFVEKPWDNHRLLSILRNQIALGAAQRRVEARCRERLPAG